MSSCGLGKEQSEVMMSCLLGEVMMEAMPACHKGKGTDPGNVCDKEDVILAG